MRSARSNGKRSDCTDMASDHSADVKCASSSDSSTNVAQWKVVIDLAEVLGVKEMMNVTEW